MITSNKHIIRLFLYSTCNVIYIICDLSKPILLIKFKGQQILNPLSQPSYQLVGDARSTMRSSLLLALLMLVLVPAAWGRCLLKILCPPESPQRCTARDVCLQNHMIKAPSLRNSENCPPGRRWAGNRCRSLWR